MHRVRSPRVINTDQARLYGSAIPAVKEEGLCAAAADIGRSNT